MFLKEEWGTSPGILRYELLPGEPVDEYTLEVLRQNTPKGVLLLGRERTEAYDHLLLPISQLVKLTSIDLIVNNGVTYDKFLLQVREILERLPKYMIPKEELLLRPEWTFLEPESGYPVLPVLPTPLAKDLSLSLEDYATLIRKVFEEQGQIATEKEKAGESAKRSAKGATPQKPFRKRVQEFWESLD